jgi:hypothetical protein
MAAGDPGTRKRNYSATAIETKLLVSISAAAQGDTTINVVVNSVSGFPGTVPYTLILEPDTSKEEVVTVTAASSTNLTITRGQDNTQAVAHTAGSSVRHGVSAREFKELQTHISARGVDVDSAIMSGVDSHVHGIVTGEGVVVGTLKAQDLTQKNIYNSTFSGSITSTATITFSGGGTINGLSNPTSDAQVSNKAYVDLVLTTSGTSAAISASSAATSASSAAATYVTFNNRYLGPKTSVPTVDNYGGTLLVGASYWNTPANTMYAWSGSTWVAISTTGVGSVSGTAGRITSTGGTAPILDLATAGTAGTYAYPASVTTDAYGRVTAATGGTAPVLLSGSTMTGFLTLSADPSSALHAVTKQYADGIAAGFNAHSAVVAATTGNLTATYTAGSAGADGGTGVGATLTITATGAFILDGVTTALNDRILVKDQTTATQNGIYTITTAGTTGVSAVLTRASDFNNSIAGEVIAGDTTFVQGGQVNVGNGYVMNSVGTSTTPAKGIKIGTDNIVWTLFSQTAVNAADALMSIMGAY